MSPAQTAPNVGAWLAERDRVNARLARRLAELGAWGVLDAVYGDDLPQMLRGKAVPRGH